MSITLEYFGKTLQELDSADIYQFFAKQPAESSQIEFKSGEVDRGKLMKEVCAFLNAEGGLIFIGAPREAEEGKLTSSQWTAAQLSAYATGAIVPQPQGILFREMQMGEGRMVILQVPASAIPPHQLNGSGQYYIREGSVSRPAVHREVEEMFLQKRRARLNLQIEIERPNDALLLRFILQNTSPVSAPEPGMIIRFMRSRKPGQELWQEQRMAHGVYLAEGQNWIQEAEVLPRDSHFFISCQYFYRDGKPKLKAAFAHIQHRQIELLEVFNSEVHTDFNLWYEQWVYLLDS